MTDSPDPVIFERLPTANGAAIGLITLNVEKTINSLTLDMVDRMHARLLEWQQADDIVAVVLRGAGEKGLCAGGDVQALYKSVTATPGGPCDYAEAFFEREYRLDYLLHTLNKPVLSWGHGIVMGGGLGVHAGARHKVVTERTRFAMPEIGIALFPDVGATWFLNRMPGKTGLFVALTAAALNASDAIYLGLGNHFIHNDRQAEVLAALQQLPWQRNADQDNALLNSALTGLADTGMPAGNVEKHLGLINKLCAGADFPAIVEAILALDTQDKWLANGVKSLAQGSPISACITDRQLRQGKGLALAAVFRFELVLATNILRYPEFAEGVRALLIDKDRQPHWQYPTVNAVPERLIDDMFTPPWDTHPLADLGSAAAQP